MATLEGMKEHCSSCNASLDMGQIGNCDECQEAASTTQWTNYYLCPCGEHWNDEWDCACNDRCPSCNKEIQPYISDDGSLEQEQIDAAFSETMVEMGLVECGACDKILSSERATEPPHSDILCQTCRSNS